MPSRLTDERSEATMDPNACLEEIRELVSDIFADDKSNIDSLRRGDRLAELVEALDGWLSKGGFLPADWTTKERSVAP